MSRTSTIAFVVAVALATLPLSACTSRNRGRVPGDSSTTRDSSTTDSGTDGGGSDGGATDSGGGGTDSGPTPDTGTPPPTCTPTLVVSGAGAPLADGSTTTESPVYAGSCGGDRAPEAVIEWHPGAAGRFQIDTIGSEFDTMLYVRSAGAAPCTGTEIACDDDGGDGATSLVVIDAAGASDVIYIFIDGYAENSGPFLLNVTRLD